MTCSVGIEVLEPDDYQGLLTYFMLFIFVNGYLCFLQSISFCIVIDERK